MLKLLGGEISCISTLKLKYSLSLPTPPQHPTTTTPASHSRWAVALQQVMQTELSQTKYWNVNPVTGNGEAGLYTDDVWDCTSMSGWLFTATLQCWWKWHRNWQRNASPPPGMVGSEDPRKHGLLWPQWGWASAEPTHPDHPILNSCTQTQIIHRCLPSLALHKGVETRALLLDSINLDRRENSPL